MASQRPIRVALVGLTANPGVYAWANNVHFPYLKNSPHFEIVAVLGSTRQAAEGAIKKFELPSTVKAYGSPEDLAADANVDLVSIVTKVGTHRSIAEPSISAGKDVFVEWPLDVNLEGAEHIAALAKQRQVRSMMGLQARHSAVVVRAAQLVEEGAIGKVLSTTVVGTVPTGGGGAEPKSVRYSLDAKSGATMVDIHFAHFIEAFSHVLGEVKSLSSVIATQRPTVDILDEATGATIEENIPKTAPDQVMMQGTLESGAVVSLHIHGGSSIGGGFRWHIYGTSGEIEITGPALLLHIGMPVPWNIRVSDASGAVVKEEAIPGEPTQPAVASLYEAYRKGEASGVPDFEHAVKRHRIVQAMYDSFESGKVITI